MKNKIILKVPYFDQWQDTKNKKWAGKTCAICCLKMVLVFKNKKHSKLAIMDLVKEGLLRDGYMAKIGWKHKALVLLAKKHGVNMDFQKLFFYSPEEKLKGLKFINKHILKQKPVIASVLNKKRNGGHMVVVNGLSEDKGTVTGYFIVDPNSKNGDRYFFTKEEFINNWRGGLLWLLD